MDGMNNLCKNTFRNLRACVEDNCLFFGFYTAFSLIKQSFGVILVVLGMLIMI